MTDIYSVGIRGIQSGMTILQQSAASIASSITDDSHRDQALINLRQGKTQVEVSAKIITTANKTMGYLLDVFV